MDPLILRSIVEKIFGTLIRHGLTSLGVWIASKGVGTLETGTINNLTDLVVGTAVIVISFALSYYKSKKAEKTKVELESMKAENKPWEPEHRPSGIPPAALMLFCAFLSSAMVGCAVMHSYDQNSYESAQALKADTLDLIAHAQEPFAGYASRVQALQSKLSAQAAYEHGKGKSNVISATQWDVLVDPNRDLLGKLLVQWEAGQTFSKTYLVEKSQQIADAFDQILKLEGAKQR